MSEAAAAHESADRSAIVPARPPRRNLVRRYLALSLLVTVVVTGLLSVGAEWAISRALIAKDQEQARLAAAFLWDQLQEHWLDRNPPEGMVWPTDTHPHPLDYVVQRFQKEQRVTFVNLINGDGEVLYSSNVAWMGVTREDPEDLAAVMSEGISSHLLGSGAKLHLGGSASEPLLETSVRAGELNLPGKGATAAIIELYRPAGHLVADLEISRFWVIAAALFCFAAMFTAHLFLFIQGNRTIAARTRALEELSASLEDKVRERTLELATSRRLADVGRLAAGVAHEINTPIASIATCADGLLRRSEDPDARRYLEIVRKEAFRVKAITRTLLDFSRTRADVEDPGRRRRVEVRAALREITDLLAFTLEERRIRLVSDVDPPGLSVLVDPAALHQILLNLTANSMDALPDGGEIRWEARERGDSVRIRCHDDGSGIAAEILPQVLDPFVTTKAAGEGTGLGLSLAWTLARRQGGTLTIDSPGPDQGTTATLLFPLPGS